MTNDTLEKIRDILDTYKERAVDAYKNGNHLAGMYLACIAGMWANSWHYPEKPNLFENEEIELYKWYIYGHAANVEAIKSNEREMARRKKIQEERDKKQKSLFKRVMSAKLL